MRKVKSAPSNLSMMCNKKKQVTPIIKSTESIVAIIQTKPTKPTKPTNFTKIKKFKTMVANSGSVINDLISDNKIVSLEESTIITALISYLSENINKTKKLNELYIYIIQYIARYIVLLLIHSTILHDNSDKFLPSINYLQHFIK